MRRWKETRTLVQGVRTFSSLVAVGYQKHSLPVAALGLTFYQCLISFNTIRRDSEKVKKKRFFFLLTYFPPLAEEEKKKKKKLSRNRVKGTLSDTECQSARIRGTTMTSFSRIGYK